MNKNIENFNIMYIIYIYDINYQGTYLKWRRRETKIQCNFDVDPIFIPWVCLIFKVISLYVKQK